MTRVSRALPTVATMLTLTAVLATGCTASAPVEPSDTDPAPLSMPDPAPLSMPDPAPLSVPDPASLSASEPVAGCGPGSGATKNDGSLTLATDSPAYPPWFASDDPANGEGYEGAVARQVAERLGYDSDSVRFVVVPVADALAPGVKDFDFAINQFTISDDRRSAVDFSSPYYAVAQAVVALRESPAAEARSTADLVRFRLGAQEHSTSLGTAAATVQTELPGTAYATNDDAKEALLAGEIDALVVDLPTGLQISEELSETVMVGQFSRSTAAPDRFGLVLEKDSPMTTCVSIAVETLYDSGVLDALAGTWITDTAGVRVLD